jgi:hypothetical protein
VEIPREHFLLGRVAVRDFSHYKVLEKMQLYERRLESSLHKTRAELQKLQAARKAEEKAREKSAPAGDQGKLKKQSQSPAFGGTTPDSLPDVCCPAPSRKSEALNPKSETIGSCAVELKKQSQSAAGQIEASSDGEMRYDDISHRDSAANRTSHARPEHGRGGEFDEPGSITGVGQTSGGRA